MAKVERLAPFSDFELIDAIVQGSSGAYKHDEVFLMSLDFVYKLNLLHYEKQQFLNRFNLYQKEFNK